tara:strand:+ start:74 stop:1243 length:1170 start_codon:yes stop_codon:yes gene_type:complete
MEIDSIEITPSSNDHNVPVTTTTFKCHFFHNIRDTIIGKPTPTSTIESKFIRYCRVLMSMQQPVAFLLFTTVAYVWICGLHHDGSDPFIRNLPVFLGIGLNRTTDISTIALASLYNSLFLLSTVIFVTLLFLILFTFKCRKLCFCILIGAFVLTTTAAPIYLTWKACVRYNIILDWFTVVFFSWNFSIVGVLLVHWETLQETLELYHDHNWTAVSESPLNAHNWIVHVYLVLNAVGLTWPFSSMDEWTVWSFLVLLVLWDLFAVLTPCGPLRYIMELERKRKTNGIDQFKLPPGLIYETPLFQLGTGDLLFYGVIVGRAATISFICCSCTALAIFAGMSATIWITVQSDMHALPALPLAIVLAFFSLFTSRYLLVDYLTNNLNAGILVI